MDGITDSMGVSLSKPLELVMDGDAWHAAVHGVAKRRTWLRDWTELKKNENVSVGVDVQKSELLHTIGVNVIYSTASIQKKKSIKVTEKWKIKLGRKWKKMKVLVV